MIKSLLIAERPGTGRSQLLGILGRLGHAPDVDVADGAGVLERAALRRPEAVIVGTDPGFDPVRLVATLRTVLGGRVPILLVRDAAGSPGAAPAAAPAAALLDAGATAFLRSPLDRWEIEALLRGLSVQGIAQGMAQGASPGTVPDGGLAALVDALPLPAVVTMLDDGRIVCENALVRRALRAESVNAADVRAHHFYDDEADRDRFVAALRSGGGVAGYEIRMRRFDGTFLWALVAAQPLPAADGPLLLTIFIDVTERKTAQDDLVARERYFRRMADSMPAMLYVTDDRGSTVFTNRLSAVFTGLSADAMRGGAWLGVIHPDDREGIARTEADAVREQRGYEYEYRTRRADGAWRWTLNRATPYPDNSGRFGGLIGICLDITSRREAEQAVARMARTVAESNELARIATDGAGLGTWELDLLASQSKCSERSRAHFGLLPDEAMTDERFWRGVHPDDRERVRDAIAQACRPSGDGRYAAEFRIVRPDGRTLWLAAQGIAFFDGDGSDRRAVRMVGISMDVTDRRAADDRIKASLGEKEMLLREIHHRVKNNLQGLWGLLQIEAHQLRDSGLRARLDAISRRITVMGQVHQQLYGANNFARIDLNRQLGDLAHMLHALDADPERISLSVEVAPLTCDIDTAIPLGLIANELISNSLKHAFPDGRSGWLTVRMGNDRQGRVVLTVEDDGAGIPGPAGSHGGVGTMLVAALAGQIDGTIECREGGAGHSTSLSLAAGRFQPA
ncbi:MAG TPA: PAS domain S-box protein [Arenibaculum sp.]|nr:PAS domain S-box protein [Arenibaculum sp.]